MCKAIDRLGVTTGLFGTSRTSVTHGRGGSRRIGLGEEATASLDWVGKNREIRGQKSESLDGYRAGGPMDVDRAWDVGGIAMNAFFRRFETRASVVAGSPWAFLAAALFIIIWAAVGPYYLYSDTWQMVINTAPTIVTFLMIFLIQNTQNRDALATHLKLAELIRAVEAARTELVNLEELPDEKLHQLKEQFERLQRMRITIEPSEEALSDLPRAPTTG
jgi:low affinity Fe/Cu permease